MVTTARVGAPRPHEHGHAVAASAAQSVAPLPWRAPSPFPKPFETSRTILRFWDEADAVDLLAAVNEDRGSLLPWLSCFRADYRSIGQCHYHIDRFRRQHQ
jgi:hypothetical protein